MTKFRALLSLVTVALAALAGVACFGSGGEKAPTPIVTPTRAAAVTVPATSTPAPVVPTVEPTPAPPATYVVEAGDNPTLIAEALGVPDSDLDAWITELLALNDTEATALQIGQELILPPFGTTAVATEPSTAQQPAGGSTGASAAATQPVSTAQASSATQSPAATQPAATTAPGQAAAPTATSVAPTATSAPTVATSTPVSGATVAPTSPVPPGTVPDPIADCSIFHSQGAQNWCSNPDGDVLNCDEFPTMTGEATYFTLTVDYTDINGLDADGDGRSCED